jgi:hypothetical protein
MKIRWVFGLFLLVFLFSGCSSSSVKQVQYRKNVKLQTSLAAGGVVKVHADHGSIVVQGADVTNCDIVAGIVSQAMSQSEAQRLADAVDIRLVSNGSTVTVNAEKPACYGNESISVSYLMIVPEQTSVTCSSSYGDINLSNLAGVMTARSSHGKISCRDIDGDVELRTAYGDVNCENICVKDMKVKTNYGDINILCSRNCPNDVSAWTRTLHGKIDFKAPVGFGGRVELATNYGSIFSGLPVTMEGILSDKHVDGYIGTGGGDLVLKTNHGKISLR